MKRFAIVLLAIGFVALMARGQEPKHYEFPKGVPINARAVTWYAPTTTCQDERGGYKHLSNQSWNQERPWINAGMEESPNVETFKFKLHAKRSSPWQENARYFANGGFYRRWSYETGSLFGEVIQADGRTVEVFTLEFVAGKKEPVFHRYRPFGKRSEIAAYIQKETITPGRYRDQHGRPIPTNQVGRNGESMSEVLARGPVIDEQALIHQVELSPEGVQAVLARPWRDVIDVVFSEKDGLKCYGPTTRQRQGIVPINSRAGFFSSKSCLKCHTTAGAEGRLLDPDSVPDKYGAIRGNGFVFSDDE